MPKVFCIGLNKTGSTSLHIALTHLGLKSLHANAVEHNKQTRRALCEGKPLLHYLDSINYYDAYLDLVDVTWHFDMLDAQYPDSKFILTQRDLSSWISSRTKHIQRNILRRQRGRYNGHWLTVDVDSWTKEWYLHDQKVREYFVSKRHQLLILNICAGDGYKALCPFLNKQPFNETFPWANRKQS